MTTEFSKQCDTCNVLLQRDAFLHDYDTTCESCLTTKAYMIETRNFNSNLLLKKLAASKVKQHVVVEGVEFKHCSSCGVFLPLDQFYMERGRHDGLSSRCKQCNNQYVRLLKLRKRAKKLGINTDF